MVQRTAMLLTAFAKFHRRWIVRRTADTRMRPTTTAQRVRLVNISKPTGAPLPLVRASRRWGGPMDLDGVGGAAAAAAAAAVAVVKAPAPPALATMGLAAVVGLGPILGLLAWLAGWLPARLLARPPALPDTPLAME